ncbi:MAG: hypothetical protein HYV97_03080 [Bdellovibrio sp.]|nr:hypothetical protein [Bdellovibrio sp.]
MRKPANLVPDDEMEIVPVRQTLWTEQILVEDDAGVLKNMQNQISEWDTQRNYVELWDLESTGLYDPPSDSRKQSYIGTNLLRYFDKRLAGEIKNSEDNSALRAVGQMQKTLRPKAEARISENVKLRFKAQALQGKAYFILENPYVETQTLVTASGRVELSVAKSLKRLGVATRVNYYANQGEYVGEVDKSLTDHIIARYSSRQNDKTMMFNKQSDQTIQLLYSLPF